MVNMPWHTYSDDNKTKSKVPNKIYWKLIYSTIISTKIKGIKYNLKSLSLSNLLSFHRLLLQIVAFIEFIHAGKS